MKIVYTSILLLSVLLIACNQTDSLAKNNTKKAKENSEVDYSIKFNEISLKDHQLFQDSIKSYYYSQLSDENFSGQFLVAKNGKIIFQAYKGFQNLEAGNKMTYETPIHVASISKTITAIALMRLVDKNKIGLDDSVQKYIKDFPFHGITVRMLLNHRSGIPYYGYLPTDILPSTKFIKNKDLISLFKKDSIQLYFPPNTQFSYCNTNYAFLALIIEKVTKTPFPKYIKKDIIDPLKMKNSFVFEGDTSQFKTIGQSYNSKSENQGLSNLDLIYGDKNFYTTAIDLYKLDKATYSNNFLSKKARKEIFKGYSYENPGKSNYGLGFRLREEKGKKTIFFHTGWWHGNTGCYATLRKDTVCMIVLSNQYTKKVFSINSLSLIFGDYCVSPLIDQKENFIDPKTAKDKLSKRS